MFSPHPFPGWAPRLLTGNSDLDSEHRLLLNAIARLGEICAEVQRPGGASTCLDREEIINLLGDLLAFLLDHFCAEEKLMKACGLTVSEKELCDIHIEDHAAISDMVLRIVATVDSPQTSSLVQELHAVMEKWLDHHIAIHDTALIRMIGQD